MSYYDQYAELFIADTLHLDMTHIYEPFLEQYSGKSLLDIGCGPGRDLKYFSSLGYDVTGIEPSKILAQFARKHSGARVIENTIQALKTEQQFDGIWACASLLHVPSDQLVIAFNKIAQVTKVNGVIYCSFKYGDFEGERNGRFFNFRTLESLREVLPTSLQVIKDWITHDQRVGRSDEWLNIIMKKAND